MKVHNHVKSSHAIGNTRKKYKASFRYSFQEHSTYCILAKQMAECVNI